MRQTHTYKTTERRDHGVILKFHGCTSCKPAHLVAYDMEVQDKNAFAGKWEYEERNKRE